MTRAGPSITRREALQVLGLATAGALVLAGCSRTEPAPPALRLATGPAGAVYREMGAALIQLWNGAWGSDVVQAVPTGASVDNLGLLLARDVELGFVNADVAGPHRDELRSLLRVFDSVVHVLVPAGSPAHGLADLEGLRVSLGLPGSGTRFVADRLLEVSGTSVARSGLGQQEAARALAEGRIDALVSLTAMPTPAVSWLLDQPGDGYRFLPLGPAVSRMHEEFPAEYLDVTISQAVYPGAAATPTIAVPTLLLARADLPDDVARFLTRTTIEGAATLRDARPEAWQINPRTAIATSPVPLHDGSAAWFRAVKP